MMCVMTMVGIGMPLCARSFLQLQAGHFRHLQIDDQKIRQAIGQRGEKFSPGPYVSSIERARGRSRANAFRRRVRSSTIVIQPDVFAMKNTIYIVAGIELALGPMSGPITMFAVP